MANPHPGPECPCPQCCPGAWGGEPADADARIAVLERELAEARDGLASAMRSTEERVAELAEERALHAATIAAANKGLRLVGAERDAARGELARYDLLHGVLVAERDAARGEIAELLAGADADAHLLARANRELAVAREEARGLRDLLGRFVAGINRRSPRGWAYAKMTWDDEAEARRALTTTPGAAETRTKEGT